MKRKCDIPTIAVALLLLAAPASANEVGDRGNLKKGTLLCKTQMIYYKISAELASNPAAINEFVTRGGCIYLPKGTFVTVTNVNPGLECLRAENKPDCNWTSPAELDKAD